MSIIERIAKHLSQDNGPWWYPTIYRVTALVTAMSIAILIVIGGRLIAGLLHSSKTTPPVALPQIEQPAGPVVSIPESTKDTSTACEEIEQKEIALNAEVYTHAILYAAARGDRETADNFLREFFGVDSSYSVYSHDYSKLAPAILYAASIGDAAFVKVMLTPEPEDNGSNKAGKNVRAMVYAASKGSAATVREMLDGTADNYNSLSDALRYAARKGRTSAIKVLIFAYGNHDVECGIREPVEAIWSAADEGDTATVKSLAAASMKDGEEALGRAISEGRVGIVRVLVTAGVDVNTSEVGPSLLPRLVSSYAYENGMLKVLIEGGADLDERDNEGNTALIIAASSGYTDVVEVLLDAGAGVNVKSRDGKTALMLAEENGNDEIVRLLRAAGAK
jgi:ankyrin repeat protein